MTSSTLNSIVPLGNCTHTFTHYDNLIDIGIDIDLYIYNMWYIYIYIWICMRDLLYPRLLWVCAIPCHYFSDVQSISICPFCFVIVWRVWETCHIVEHDGCERPVITCRSFSYVESLLFFFILCTGLSTFIPSYYLQSRLWIYISIYIYIYIYTS